MRSLSDLPSGHALHELTAAASALMYVQMPTTDELSVRTGCLSQWLSLLLSDFSLIVHGFGAKKLLLDTFIAPLRVHAPVVVLNGCSPNSSARGLLQQLAHALGLPIPAGGIAAMSSLLRTCCAHAAQNGIVAALQRRIADSDILTRVQRLLQRGSDILAADQPSVAATSSAKHGRAQRRHVNDRLAHTDENAGDEALSSTSLFGPRRVVPTLDEKAKAPRCKRARELSTLHGPLASGMATEAAPGNDDACDCSQWSRRLREKVSVLGATPGDVAAAAERALLPAHIFVVVHGLDRLVARDGSALGAIALIASLPQVHLLASVSHRHAVLCWDPLQARLFNWAWVEANTAYSCVEQWPEAVQELMGCLCDGSESGEGRSAQLVLGALTKNAQSVFKELLRQQLAEPKGAGMPFQALYALCRVKMIATSEAALKGHITEFVDHHLVRTRLGAASRQCYYCTLPKQMMEQIVAA